MAGPPTVGRAFAVPRSRPTKSHPSRRTSRKNGSWKPASVTMTGRHGREEVSKRPEKSRLHSRVSEPALGMNLEIKRERSAADRHSCDENALIADGLGPIDQDYRPRPDSPMPAPRSSAQDAPDHRIENQPAFSPQMAISEQAIDPLDAVLRSGRASDASTQSRERQPANLNHRFDDCHKCTESNGVD